MDGYSSTAVEAIWPLAILDCEEKRGAVRLLTRPLRRALQHLQLNGCVLPEDYSRHFYNDADIAAWKVSSDNDRVADLIGQAGLMSGRFEQEDEKEQSDEKEKEEKKEEMEVDGHAMIAEAKAAGELSDAHCSARRKPRRSARVKR